MSTPTDDYVLRFTSGSDALIAKDEAMALARSRSMSLRDFILSALVHERERILGTPMADDGPLSDQQIAWLRDQFPETSFDGEDQVGPSLW